MWKKVVIWIVVGFIVSGQSLGCAGANKCTHYQKDVQTRVSIRLNRCHDEPGGKYRCDGVLFDPQEIKAK